MKKRFGNFNKRGFEINELAKILLAIVLLAILTFAVIYLFKGKGSTVLDTIKRMLRLGR